MPTDHQRRIAIRDMVICAALDALIKPGDVGELFGITALTVQAIQGRRLVPLPATPDALKANMWHAVSASKVARREANKAAFHAQRQAKEAARLTAKAAAQQAKEGARLTTEGAAHSD